MKNKKGSARRVLQHLPPTNTGAVILFCHFSYHTFRQAPAELLGGSARKSGGGPDLIFQPSISEGLTWILAYTRKPPYAAKKPRGVGPVGLSHTMNQPYNGMLAASLSISFHCLHGCDCVNILTMCLMKSLDQGMDFKG